VAYLSIDALARLQVLEHLVRTSRAPAVSQVAAELGVTDRETAEAFDRLEKVHAFVLEEGTRRIEMAPPFSAVETSHVVSDGEREWFSSCAWEALGLLPLLGCDGTIRSVCPDCEAQIDLVVKGKETTGDVIFHIAVPAKHWWADIRFT